jgi:hypothetical protein
MVGRVFGRLTVLSKGDMRNGSRYWVCQCSCGTTKMIQGSNLYVIKSCGCYRREFRRTHGMYRSPEYKAWDAMIQRCSNPRTRTYRHYGGRGITVSPSWLSFDTFFRDMGTRPAGHTLERLENDGNYEPGNCAWVDWPRQNSNKRTNRFIAHEGRRQTIADWANELGLPYSTLHARLFSYGWPIARALTPPL